MKKIFATILILLYFTATTEATVHLHFCMGEFKSMSLWHKNASGAKCTVCGMANKKGCCEDRHVVVKTEKKYSMAAADDLVPKIFVQPASFIHHFLLPVFSATGLIPHAYSHAPPGKSQIPLFIRYCVYLL